MLIKNYKVTSKQLNNNKIEENWIIFNTFNWIKYPTTEINIFDTYTSEQIFTLIDEQKQFVKKTADIYYNYWWLSKAAYDNTILQYNELFYLNWYFYKKEEIKHYIAKKNSEYNTTVSDIITISEEYDPSSIPLTQPKISYSDNQPKKQVIEISRTAIRNITWYTPYFTPSKWEWPTTYVKRQDDLIEDENDLILVLGSRQIWKSYSLSEKAIEESFKANNDILVWAFTAKSTTTIRRYVQKYISKFPEWYWLENKKEWFIQNLQTGSHIYFSTLADDAVDSVRWMTLNTILVDEAQLVSEYAYTEVLEPTLATTWGKMVLIWTAPKVPTWFFVEQIFNHKKWILKHSSFYEIKITDQPFTHPKQREKVMSQKDIPRIQRERFCNLNTDVDTLFKIPKAQSFPIQSNQYFYVMWIDPARLWDRSWFSITQIGEWKVTVIQSWFVPDTHKSKWELQALYFKKILQTLPQDANITTVMDVSWVWDWVYTIFKSLWLNINYTVRYTSWATISLKNTNYTVSKSILINSLLDFISEDYIEVIDITNKDLLEELLYIYETNTKAWLLSFESKFFDDITNSLMINAFIIREKKLLSKAPQVQTDIIPSSWSPVVDWIEWLWNQEYQSSCW